MFLTHFKSMITAKISCCLLIGKLITLCEFSNDCYNVLREIAYVHKGKNVFSVHKEWESIDMDALSAGG